MLHHLVYSKITDSVDTCRPVPLRDKLCKVNGPEGDHNTTTRNETNLGFSSIPVDPWVQPGSSTWMEHSWAYVVVIGFLGVFRMMGVLPHPTYSPEVLRFRASMHNAPFAMVGKNLGYLRLTVENRPTDHGPESVRFYT